MKPDTEITPVAWSISQLMRTMAREGVLYIQGFDYGKPDRTLCGQSYNEGGLWDFEAHPYPPDQFQGCKRCEAGYRRWLKTNTGATVKVTDLTDIQRQHLAWRLDHKTACGYITAGRIARGEILCDRDLVGIFEWAGKSAHAAKIHARKVLNFRLGVL